MIECKDGPAPYVIDRMLPRGMFERVHGSFDLVADPNDKTKPLTFNTTEAAEVFLREQLDAEGIAAYEWIIRPLLDTQIPERLMAGQVQ